MNRPRSGAAHPVSRRRFLTDAGIAIGIANQRRSVRAQRPIAAPVYAAVGPELTHYDLDVTSATLTKRLTTILPENVQEAWPHPSRRLLYVAWSDGGRAPTARHGVSTFRVDAASGALVLATRPTPLFSRPIHLTVDHDGQYLFVAYNFPSGLSVHRLASDGMIGPLLPQSQGLDFGIYAHHVRVAPSNRFVILVTRGNEPGNGASEDPGALKVFGFENGVLTPRGSIALDDGHAFRSRHLDFHPSGRWAYLTLESQNRLLTFDLAENGLSGRPLFNTTTLSTSRQVPQQIASTVHVHPGGRSVYVANRATGTMNARGTAVFAGGENTIATFAVDQRTGEPSHVQSVDTRGVQPRTFVLDPSGRTLVVGNQSALPRLDNDRITMVQAGLSLFTVGANGQLAFVRKYDVDTSQGMLFWVGMFGR